MVIFAGVFFLSLLVRGYLFGRYHEVRVDGLKVGYIPTFCGIACGVVAYNEGVGWWPIPLAPPAAFLLGECFAAAITLGRRHSRVYRRVVLVPKETLREWS